MNQKSKRPYKSVNVLPDDHERLRALSARFSGAEPSRTQPVSLPETLRRLLDYFEDHEGVTQ